VTRDIRPPAAKCDAHAVDFVKLLIGLSPRDLAPAIYCPLALAVSGSCNDSVERRTSNVERRTAKFPRYNLHATENYSL
jgi:hypothetical protein